MRPPHGSGAKPASEEADPVQDFSSDTVLVRLEDIRNPRATDPASPAKETTAVIRTSALKADLPETPELRTDLQVAEEPGDRVRVTRPDGRSFQLYSLEWKLAGMMDGSRGIDDLARHASRLGVGGDTQHVRSFIRDLRNYGFLVSGNAAAPAAPRATLTNALEAAMSEEERQLLELASGVESQGGEKLAGYLAAVLEINPSNQPAAELLKRVRSAAPRPTGPIDGGERAGEVDIERRLTGGAGGTGPQVVVQTSSRGLKIGIAAAVLIVLIAVPLGVWTATMRANRKMLEELQRQAPREAQPVVVRAASTPEVILRVPLQPAARSSLVAKVGGFVTSVAVQPGADVGAGDVILSTMDGRSYQRYARAQRAYQRAEARARTDDVYRYYLAEARADFEAATRKLTQVPVKATTVGVVEAVRVAAGQQVAAGDEIAIIVSAVELEARFPASDFTFSLEGASCQLEGAIRSPCQLILSEGEVIARVENEGLAIAANKTVSLRISAKQ